MTVFGDRCSNDKITNESVNIRTGHISNKSPSVLVFSIKKTCHKINPEKSYHKVKSEYLLVYLAKQNPGSDLSHTTNAEKAAADSKKEADEPEFDDKGGPSAGLMNMMVDILLNVELENFQANGDKCSKEEAEQVGPVREHAYVHGGREDSYTGDKTASPNSRLRPAIALTPDQQTGNNVLKIQRMTINLNSTIHMYVLYFELLSFRISLSQE